MGDNEIPHTEEVEEYIQNNGLSGIQEFLRKQLKEWEDIEINIGITGDSGAGKSSFINAVRGLKDSDEGAAATGNDETTTEAAVYSHPTNEKIKFWDLPGIGTPNRPNVKILGKEVNLQTFDSFLIFTAGSFTETNRLLAKKLESLEKSFLFVRAKIDLDVANNKRRKIDEEGTLKQTREKCRKNLSGLAASKNKVFLISNHETTKWDFLNLTQAILDDLPVRQRESLTLSLDLLITCSKDLIRRKVQVLRGRIWKIAAASGVGALVPVPGLSFSLDFALLTSEMDSYKSQLGLPEESSDKFQILPSVIQEKIRRYCWKNPEALGKLFKSYGACTAIEEFSRYIPYLGSIIAASISFGTTYRSLSRFLSELENTALECLDHTKANLRSGQIR